MITNMLKPSQYKVSEVECLIQAYDNVFKINNELTPRDRIWEYNQIVLRTSLILIHQGIEGLMKAKICEVPPLCCWWTKNVRNGKHFQIARMKLTTICIPLAVMTYYALFTVIYTEMPSTQDS